MERVPLMNINTKLIGFYPVWIYPDEDVGCKIRFEFRNIIYTVDEYIVNTWADKNMYALTIDSDNGYCLWKFCRDKKECTKLKICCDDDIFAFACKGDMIYLLTHYSTRNTRQLIKLNVDGTTQLLCDISNFYIYLTAFIDVKSEKFAIVLVDGYTSKVEYHLYNFANKSMDKSENNHRAQPVKKITLPIEIPMFNEVQFRLMTLYDLRVFHFKKKDGFVTQEIFEKNYNKCEREFNIRLLNNFASKYGWSQFMLIMK
jgi:hypothetical protein